MLMLILIVMSEALRPPVLPQLLPNKPTYRDQPQEPEPPQTEERALVLLQREESERQDQWELKKQ